jgi:hypothetical protein
VQVTVKQFLYFQNPDPGALESWKIRQFEVPVSGQIFKSDIRTDTRNFKNAELSSAS